MRSKATMKVGRKPLRPLTESLTVPVKKGHVIDFIPYLERKRKQAARDSVFLTLFLVFVSLFIIVL